MKRPIKLLALSLALSFPVAGVLASQEVSVAHASSAERLNLGVDTGKGKFKESTVNLKQDEANKSEALAQIKQIRSRLWDENIYYTYETSNSKGTRLQDVAKAQGFKTKEAYVNAITWSNDLERIAIQRAYEQVYVDLSHDRPDGSGFETLTTNSGVSANGENLAASSGLESPAQAFGQWSFTPSKSKNGQSEYDILLKTKGVENGDNGHLHLILDPRFHHVGFATMNGASSEWNYAAMNASIKSSGNNQAATGYVGSYRLYIGTPTKEEAKSQAPSKNKEESKQKLSQAVERAKREIAAAEYILDNYPKTVANVKDQLVDLIAHSKSLIKKAEPLLANN